MLFWTILFTTVSSFELANGAPAQPPHLKRSPLPCDRRCRRIFDKTLQRISYSFDAIAKLAGRFNYFDERLSKEVCWRAFDFLHCMDHCEDPEKQSYSDMRKALKTTCQERAAEERASFTCITRYHNFLEIHCSSYMNEAIAQQNVVIFDENHRHLMCRLTPPPSGRIIPESDNREQTTFLPDPVVIVVPDDDEYEEVTEETSTSLAPPDDIIVSDTPSPTVHIQTTMAPFFHQSYRPQAPTTTSTTTPPPAAPVLPESKATQQPAEEAILPESSVTQQPPEETTLFESSVTQFPEEEAFLPESSVTQRPPEETTTDSLTVIAPVIIHVPTFIPYSHDDYSTDPEERHRTDRGTVIATYLLISIVVFIVLLLLLVVLCGRVLRRILDVLISELID